MSQAFAIKGGPEYPGAKANIVGTYAGVLDPTDVGSNTLGIFSVGIPQTGLASGPFLVFTGERTFVGSIQGIGDPNKSTLRANLQGVPVVTAGNTTIFTLNFHADGSMNARIAARSTTVFSVSNTRLTGSAHITTTNRNVDPVERTDTDFTVDGFKQSNTATNVPIPSGSPATGG